MTPTLTSVDLISKHDATLPATWLPITYPVSALNGSEEPGWLQKARVSQSSECLSDVLGGGISITEVTMAYACEKC